MTTAVIPELVHMASERQSTETVRIASEEADLLRGICAHAKGANNRPLKQTELLDAILHPILTAMYEETIRQIRLEPAAKLPLSELLDAMAKRVCHDHASRPKKKA